MLRNLGSVWMKTLVTIAVVFVSKPFVLGAIGIEQNDIWVTLNTMVGWLALVAAGVPMSLTRQVARRREVGGEAALRRTIGSAIGIYLRLGVIALVIGALAYPLYEHLYILPKVQPEHRADAVVGYAILVLLGASSFLGQLPYGVFNGHQDFLRPNLVITSCFVLKLLLFLVVLPLWPSVVACCAISLLIVLLEWILARRLLAKRWPGLRFSLKDYERAEAMEMARFSSWSLLLNLGIKLSFMVNGFVLAVLADQGAPTLYEAASTPILYLLPLVIAIGQVMMPRIAAWKEKGELQDLRESYLVWSKIGTAFGLFPLVWLAVEAEPFLATWMAPAFAGESLHTAAEAGLAMTILVLGTVLFLPVRGLTMQLLMAIGHVRAPALLFLAGGVLNLVLAILLVPSQGLLGAAYATAIATTALAVAMLWVGCPAIGVELIAYARYVFGPNLVVAVSTGLCLLALAHWRGPTGWLGLLFSGGLCALIYFSLWWWLAARRDDRLPWYRLPATWQKRLRAPR